MSGLGDIIAAELLKLRTTRTMWVIMLCAFGLMLVPVVLLLALVNADELRGEETLIALTMPGAAVGLAVLVTGVLGMAGEYRHATITATFLATPRRLIVVVVKLGVFFVAGVVAAVLALLLTQLAIVIVMPLRGMAIPWPSGGEWGYLGRVVLTTGLFGAAGVAIGALLRSQVLAVTITLGWIVLEQSIASPLLLATGHERIASVLPLTVFQQITGSPFQDEGAAVTTVLSSGEALLLGVAYIVVVAAAAAAFTMRRDVT